MGHHPFVQSGFGRKSTVNHRRSTRVNAIVPVTISGRDASARPFRDETQTETVNLHGARIQTHRDILVGMHVTIECPRTGSTAKAICVRTNETVQGTDLRHVSVQLERPGNIWGIENPPDDWAAIEDAQQTVQTASATQPVHSVAPPTPETSSTQLSQLEEQATQIVDAAAQRLRGLVEEMLSSAFDDFQERLDKALAAAESRMDEHSSESMAQLESTLKKFHNDLSEDLDLHSAQTIATTEKALRAQIPSILASILTPGLQTPSTPSLDLKPKH
jgi:hypothetical protein